VNPKPLTTVAQPGSGAMFDRIARRYDRMNRLLSFGLDRGWRRQAVRALELQGPCRVLDLATGTADLALELVRANAGVKVVGLDAAPGMLEIAARKVATQGLAERVELVTGDAACLPFRTGHFDACTMAFGIRNMPDRGQVLAEIRRVTRPGGQLAVLELSEPNGSVLKPLLQWHVHGLVPLLGALFSGVAEYRYLARSIKAFPRPDEFASLLGQAGFSPTRVHALTFGVAHLYLGRCGATP
jgi:demethylmenaquinone methyltransferase/2-methoxy-6-polyprenyl-1,4-benzoquinol methylase